MATERRERVAIAAALFALAIAAAPVAAAPDQISVSASVPFSSSDLAEALHVRGVSWSQQISVQLGPRGQVVVSTEAGNFEVSLEGRVGAAAARVVALTLIAEFGTEKPRPPRSTASNEFASPGLTTAATRQVPVPTTQAISTTSDVPADAKRKPKRWLSFGPALTTHFGGETGGSATGLAAGIDLFTKGRFRLTTGAALFAIHYTSINFDGRELRYDNRRVLGRVGVSYGNDYITAQVGPQVELNFYSGNCTSSSSGILGGHGAVRGVLPLGGRVGLVAAATYSIACDDETVCFDEFGLGGLPAERSDIELMAGVGYGF